MRAHRFPEGRGTLSVLFSIPFLTIASAVCLFDAAAQRADLFRDSPCWLPRVLTAGLQARRWVPVSSSFPRRCVCLLHCYRLSLLIKGLVGGDIVILNFILPLAFSSLDTVHIWYISHGYFDWADCGRVFLCTASFIIAALILEQLLKYR